MKYLGSATFALGVFAFAASASAAVVCNQDGDCWKVKKRYDYPPAAGLHIYGDDWSWPEAKADHYRWREPGAGRGYYRGGVWIGF